MKRKIGSILLIIALIVIALVFDARHKAECRQSGGQWVGGSQRGAGCVGDDKGLF